MRRHHLTSTPLSWWVCASYFSATAAFTITTDNDVRCLSNRRSCGHCCGLDVSNTVDRMLRKEVLLFWCDRWKTCRYIESGKLHSIVAFPCPMVVTLKQQQQILGDLIIGLFCLGKCDRLPPHFCSLDGLLLNYICPETTVVAAWLLRVALGATVSPSPPELITQLLLCKLPLK